MGYDSEFTKKLLEAFFDGEITFSEPNLTKIFVNFITKSFAGVTTNATLTQSNKKWEASISRGKEKAEIGDFILITRSKMFRKCKVAFIQCKLKTERDGTIGGYSKNHKSFPASAKQQRLMSGTDKKIFLMGADEFDLFYKSSSKSVSNYLVFYRTLNSSLNFYSYDCDLSSAKANVKPYSDVGLEYIKKYKDKQITLRNRKKKYTSEKGDCIFAPSFKKFIKAIDNFEVGEIIDVNSSWYKALSKYLPPEIKNQVKEFNDNNPLGDEDISGYEDIPPIIVVDSGTLNQNDNHDSKYKKIISGVFN